VAWNVVAFAAILRFAAVQLLHQKKVTSSPSVMNVWPFVPFPIFSNEVL
jgi:hypothetical protein